MANSVGSVSIDLEARIAKFESDLGRAARVAEQRSQEMRRTIGAVASALGAGLSVAGITTFVKHALDAQDAISKMSQKVGVSTEALSGWQLAAQQAGIENEAFGKGLVKLAQSSAMVLQGSKQQVDAFKSIGVSALDSTGHLKDMDKLFPEVIDKLAKYRDGTAKTAIATQLFGRAGADLIPLFNAGSEGLREYTKMAEDFGLVVGGKGAKAAEAFNDSLEQLSFVGKGIANQLATALAPALADLADKAVSFFRSGDWKKVLNDISTGAKYVADHVGDIITAIKTLGEIVATVYATKMLLWGTRWIGNLTAQSAAILANGVAVKGWGATTAASFGNAYKNIGGLGIAINLLGSAVVGWKIGKYLRDQFLEVRLAAIAFVDGTLTLWEKLKQGSDIAWEAIKATAIGAINGIREGLASVATYEASLLQKLPGGGELAKQLTEVAAKLKPATSASDDFKASVERINAEAEKNIAAIHRTTGEMADYEIAQEAAKNATAATAPVLQDQKGKLDAVNEAAIAAAKALDAYKKKQDALSAKAASVVAGYVGSNEAPDVKAWNDYANAVQKVAEAEGERIQAAIDAQKAGVAGIDVAKVEASAQRETAAAIDNMTEARDRNIAAAKQEMDTTGNLVRAMQQETLQAGMSERQAYIYRQGIQAETQYREKNIRAIGQTTEAYEAQVQAQKRIVEQNAATNYDVQKQLEFAKQVAQEYTGFWENAASSISKSLGDLFTGQTKNFRSFGQQLKSIAQQFVSDIISQFIRLRVLGPLLSGAMGSVGGWLGIAGQFLGGSSITQSAGYYGGGSTIGNSPGATGGGGGYGGFLSNISSMRSAYQYATGGGISLSGGTIVGGNSIVTGPGVGGAGYGVNLPNGAVMYGNGTTVTPYSPYGGNFTAGGYAVPYASIAGGLMGAYYGAHQGDGKWGTAGSTVAYGALGAGIAGTAAGVAGGASLGAAAGGAFGTAAAGMSWIPIVGWIAALAALVDHFSGGKIFGTKYRTDASDVSLNLGAGGPSADASVHQWKYRSQLSQAFGRFGGILLPSDWGDKDKRFKDVPVTPEMTAAAKALYDNIEKTMVQGAQKLAVDVPSMIEATLSAQSTYDKKGKLKSTDYVVEYLGRTWKEATADAAAQRLGAEALVKVVQASAGDVAQKIAEQFRASADTLLDGAQLMLAAQADIQKGNSLLALGATATLSQVVEFTKTMQADGEKLADTYNRLAQASAAYLQFIGQFQPVNNTFGGSLQAIAKQMQANIDQANALAQAAGLQHAREEDLANIHQYAAKQAADAIAQLSAAAQDLVAKLYNVTGDTLASVNAQIDKLQGKLQTATQLAIGDNSPLNAKEKLDVALKGLRSGITSADDVLALGRKLYASSADYTGLYNKVQDILQLPGAGQPGTGGIGAALDEYNGLIAKRDQMQSQAAAMARFNDAKTLAQYIADISTTHGIDYNEAASGLGFNLSDLAKDLGVSNLAGYLDNLKLADIPGTTMNAASSVVDAIQQLGRDLIQTLTGGPITNARITAPTAIGTDDPQVIALLNSINDRLAAIEGNTGDTAQSNDKMVKQGANLDLRSISGSNRNGSISA